MVILPHRRKAFRQQVDPYTVLLLHCNGADGSTTFTDDALGGAAPHTVTAQGDAQIDTAQYKFGGASGLFDGTTDRITVPTTVDFDLGTLYTVEWQMRPASLSFSIPLTIYLSTNAEKLGFEIDATYIYWRDREVGTAYYRQAHGMSVGNWYHLALVRNGATLKAYVEGTEVTGDTVAGGSMDDETLGMILGEHPDGGIYGYSGHFDELRISKNIARYTSNFTPPAAEFSPYL
jgi:hypothetical protein